MIKVRYFYSACVGLETSDATILCDPWFTEGVYDGSWYHYPPFEQALDKIPTYDYVYVSHIHPDHYDPKFLRDYLQRHPKCRVIICNFKANFLSKKMQADGIPHEVVSELNIGQTRVCLVPYEASSFDVDSALAVVHAGDSVVNMNDNLFDANQVQKLLSFIGGSPTIALLSYTGAGPYPQTYYDDPATLSEKASQKKQQFFERYKQMNEALNARVNIPFAGKYILGGKLQTLNRYRGVADAVEMLAIDPKAVVLADGGEATIDTQTLKPSRVRTEPYSASACESYARSLADKPMDYERWFTDLPVTALPFKRLLPKAYQSAARFSNCTQDYYFCIDLTGDGKEWFVCNARKGSEQSFVTKDVANLQPRSEILIDPRYLFGLLTCVFHWNNAEVGSQHRTRRIPDEFRREAQDFLSFFHV
ncbi:MAG: MBL fold metallo-hydrolase [Gammaproteobacteria bacterium]|nr:MBL fold metallo-hydrolase [Gammaproteobacteria bacterium]